MNFEYYGEYRELFPDDLRYKFKPIDYEVEQRDYNYPHGYGNSRENIIGSLKCKINDFDEVDIIFSSVLSSFWKIFKYGERICVFIPCPFYIESLIICSDCDSLKQCKEWLDFINNKCVFHIDENLSNIYNDADVEIKDRFINDDIIRYIPKQANISGRNLRYNNKKGRWKREVGLVVIPNPKLESDNLFHSLNNYDPSCIRKLIINNPKDNFECCSLMDYDLLISSGIDEDKIIIVLSRLSTPIMIEIGSSRSNTKVSENIRDDVLCYFMEVNTKTDLTRMLEFMNYYDNRKGEKLITTKYLDLVIRTYGSFDNVPRELMDGMSKLVNQNSGVYEYMRPIIEYMIIEDIDINTSSPMFPILFPDVPYQLSSKYGKFQLVAYTHSAVNYDKSKLIHDLQMRYNIISMNKLYELHKDGFITDDDIIDHGLHYIYAICNQMIRKKSMMKRVKQSI